MCRKTHTCVLAYTCACPHKHVYIYSGEKGVRKWQTPGIIQTVMTSVFDKLIFKSEECACTGVLNPSLK